MIFIIFIDHQMRYQKLKTKSWKFFTLFIIFFCVFQAKAQQATRFLELGSSLNSYRGDLNPSYSKTGASLQIGFKQNFKKRLNGHFQLGIGSFSGNNPRYQFDDESGNTTTPNLFFKTNFVSLQYDFQYHVLKNKHWQIYLSQGLGMMRFTPKDEANQSLVNQLISRKTDESYTQVTLILPTQIGITYLFDNQYGINLQTGWLNLQSDYVDNISQWGNRKKKDNLWQLKVAFVIPVSFQ
ncbi:MAG: hypothetical protein H7Y04_15205 [Verrucomicrobia bacterium]|nr:hypothetical protein [Cytophagales bacterium]